MVHTSFWVPHPPRPRPPPVKHSPGGGWVGGLAELGLPPGSHSDSLAPAPALPRPSLVARGPMTGRSAPSSASPRPRPASPRPSRRWPCCWRARSPRRGSGCTTPALWCWRSGEAQPLRPWAFWRTAPRGMRPRVLCAPSPRARALPFSPMLGPQPGWAWSAGLGL